MIRLLSNKVTDTPISIALLVGAMLLLSCDDKQTDSPIDNPETTPTQISHNHTIVESHDGKKSYKMFTPLLEKYDEAKEPFMEFRKGIKVEGYNDSTKMLETEIVADYARNDIDKDLWEARGNVIVKNYKEDRTLYTEQLFWDRKAKKIYTDVPAKVLDKGSVHRGVGFTTDENFKAMNFRRTRGRVETDDPNDTTNTQMHDTLDYPITTPATPQSPEVVKSPDSSADTVRQRRGRR